MLSEKAQEVINAINNIKQYPDINNYLEEYEGDRYLQMDNILNGHIECLDEVFKDLLNTLSNVLHGNLIDSKGQHSAIFYELRKAGYSFRTGESDSFGPLTSIYYDKEQDWFVCYG